MLLGVKWSWWSWWYLSFQVLSDGFLFFFSKTYHAFRVILWYFLCLALCFRVLQYGKHAFTFSYGERILFHFIKFYFFCYLWCPLDFDSYEMLVLILLNPSMTPVMLNLFLPSASVFEVCFFNFVSILL